MRLISYLSLFLLLSCFGRTVPTIRDTNQFILRFKTVHTGGITIIDPLSAECYRRTYRFNEQFVGGLGDTEKVDIEYCNNVVGWTNDYADVAGYWESLRVYLTKQKQNLKDKGIK